MMTIGARARVAREGLPGWLRTRGGEVEEGGAEAMPVEPESPWPMLEPGYVPPEPPARPRGCFDGVKLCKNLVAWLVLSLFLYVLLLSSCWVCTVCSDCGPYPSTDECPALIADGGDLSVFKEKCLSSKFDAPSNDIYLKEEHYEEGSYTCGCCGEPVFPAFTKYDSGSGIPSFWGAIDEHAVSVDSHTPCEHCKRYHEVVCQTCGARLGYVADDGPAPTGNRYSIDATCITYSNLDNSGAGIPLDESVLESNEDSPTLAHTHLSRKHCRAFDQVHRKWHEGECESDRDVIRHHSSIPGEWQEVTVVACGSSTLVFLLIWTVRWIRTRLRGNQGGQDGEGETEPPAESLELPSMNYVAIKVMQPDGDYALAILLDSEASLTPDECTAEDCGVSPAAWARDEIEDVTEEAAPSRQAPGTTSNSTH